MKENRSDNDEEEVKELIEDSAARAAFTMRHGRALSILPESKQEELFNESIFTRAKIIFS